MKENKASFTAMMVAHQRAYHAMHDNPKIFDDFLAYDLIPEDKRALFERVLNDSEHVISHLYRKSNNVISRARYNEDKLEEAIRQGVKQYVILGAGMDTFAFRRPDLMEQLEVFEIDHPATQEFKFNRLTELGWKIPTKLHFVPIDFAKENLETGLTHLPSYDPEAKSFFSWLGVINYLTQDEIFTTLRSITKISPAGSILVFDYADTTVFDPEKFPQMQNILEFLQNVDEPIKTGGFDASKLFEDLECLGLSLKENLNPDDIKRLYFQNCTGNCQLYMNIGTWYVQLSNKL